MDRSEEWPSRWRCLLSTVGGGGGGTWNESVVCIRTVHMFSVYSVVVKLSGVSYL